MLLPGTQMHVVTFGFICIEFVILFYLFIYRLARPDVKTTSLNIFLIFLLIIYNITGGLLPDPHLPGSFFIQNCIAYATGFITPCYFPYYVYKAFGLEKMKFHAHRGVFYFLIVPYLIFVIVFGISNDLDNAKNILIVPTFYALWVLYSLTKAIQFKYSNNFTSNESKEEIAVLFFSITPWVGLPIIAYFDLSQALEALTTNTGFLMLLALHLKRNIKQIKTEHQRVVDSEQRLKNWNTTLQTEVEKRTKELAKINEQQMNTFINLAHETKTPLTLVNNHMDDYIAHNGTSRELSVVKNSLNKLSADIGNLFDLEKFKKGFAVYNHNQVCDFSKVLNDSIALFAAFASKMGILLRTKTEEAVYIKADPLSVNRIINNLIENAIKFSPENGVVIISLKTENDKVFLSIKDSGPGISQKMQVKVFEPYYQISNQKKNTQGMGLGLSIVKKVVEDIGGGIEIISDPNKSPGTEIIVTLYSHTLLRNETATDIIVQTTVLETDENLETENIIRDVNQKTIMVVEDNKSLLFYLANKLKEYNVCTALNGHEALRKLSNFDVSPDLIISDIMMDKLDGFSLAHILAKNESYLHIPFIFLTAKSTPSDRIKGLKLGAIDFIQKPFSISELLQKIASILANVKNQKKVILNSTLTLLTKPENIKPLQDLNRFDQKCKTYNLTSREKDIAKLICEGLTHRLIGEALFIAERTVAKHAQNIFEKMQVSNKMGLCNKLEY